MGIPVAVVVVAVVAVVVAVAVVAVLVAVAVQQIVCCYEMITGQQQQ